MIELTKDYENKIIGFNKEKEKTKQFKSGSKKNVILGLINYFLGNTYDREKLDQKAVSLMKTNLPQHFVDNNYSDKEIFDKVYESIQLLYILNGYVFKP